MKFGIVTGGVLVGATLLWVMMAPLLHAGRSPSAIEQSFLSAGEETDRELALRKWKILLEDISRNKPDDLPSYISEDTVQNIIIDLYLQRYTHSGSREKAIAAHEYINQLSDKKTRLWGLIYFLQQLTLHAQLGEDTELMALAQDSIDSIYIDAMDMPPQLRGRLYYALATILTHKTGQRHYSQKELKRVHDLIVRIPQSAHRQDIMRRFGSLSKSEGSIYPATFASLYKAFSDTYPTAETLLAIHSNAVARDHFHAALYALLGIKEEKIRTAKLKEYFQRLMDEGALSRARRVAEQTENAPACVYMWSGLMREYLYYAYDEKARSAKNNAVGCAQAIDKETSRQKAFQLIEEREAGGRKKYGQYSAPDPKKKQSLKAAVYKVLQEKGIAEAAAHVRKEPDTKLRVNAFHYLAILQAAKLDRYDLLKNSTPYKKLTDSISYFINKGTPVSAYVDVKAQEKSIRNRYGQDAGNVMVYEGKSSDIGQVIHYNALPRQTGFTGEFVRSKLPLPGKGRVILSHYESNIFNSSFTRLIGNSGFVLSQKSAAPLVITIENGIVDLSTLYDELMDLGNTRCIEKKENIYSIRCPLIVGTNATLLMSGDDLSEIRLSTQSGSYILNANIIFITDVALTGWDDANNRAMWLDYERRHQFRPFFTAWNRSYSYIGNSEITALGYDHGKSYGISFSSGPNNWENLGEIENHYPPTGIIASNSFRNMMFGFYSYEANNVVLVGNEYRDNIVYGLDPHDRSSYLVMAYNTAYGTEKKHGIILSREVKKSLIAGNLSFDNRGTGIMLDRASNETLIYANTAFNNDQEGVSVLESNCNIIASNLLFDNHGSGVRIRNSHDVGVYYNQLMRNNQGITAYTLPLEDIPEHSHRDFVQDPYTGITGFAAVGNLISENGTGIFVNDIDGMFLKQNHYRRQAPSLFRGDWFATRMQDIMQMDRNVNGLVISRICPTTRMLPHEDACIFRENTTLLGDGLDLLLNRLSLPICQKAREIHSANKETG